jgi:heat shock protein HslJ
MEQENAYLTALQAAESYQVEGGQLRVTYAGGQVLVFDAGE